MAAARRVVYPNSPPHLRLEAVRLPGGDPGYALLPHLDRVDHLVVPGAQVAHQLLVLLVVTHQSGYLFWGEKKREKMITLTLKAKKKFRPSWKAKTKHVRGVLLSLSLVLPEGKTPYEMRSA